MKEQDFQFDTMIADQWGFLTRERRSGRQYVEDLGNGVLLEMVAIPGGTFLMGSPATEPDHTAHESPQHEVTIAPFSIGKHPVTQQQWMALMNANPSAFKGQRCPVESLAWFEADEFCRRLSEKSGQAYRLPSEAEWEYACRAGTATAFYFGAFISTELVNYDGMVQGTTDVGEYVPNAFGLYDMHGNVDIPPDFVVNICLP